MMLTSNRRRCRGMSLVELLLVMAILAVVMLAVMSLYIPTHQSTVVQAQVADVQGNLRLAMDRITQDLLVAGFLVDPNFDIDGGGPLRPGPVFWEGDANLDDPDDFTIRTRLISSGFGRRHPTVDPVDVGGATRITLSRPEMVEHFPVNAKVRLLNSVAMRECGPEYDEADATAAKNHVYTVTAVDPVAGTVTVATSLAVTEIIPETVLVRVRDDNQPPLQTIRYRFNAGALERIVNGETQFLARNLTGAAFAYQHNSRGTVNLVDVTLTGETKALKPDDAIAGAKTRQLQTTVTLRNVF